jgi:hypothetical protein
MNTQYGEENILALTEVLTLRKAASGSIKVNALLNDQHVRARKDLQQPVEIKDVDTFPKPGDLFVDKRTWLRVRNVVVVSADLKNSTALSFNKHAQTSARLYEAATGSGVRLMAKFDPQFMDIQGDGIFGLFHGERAYERALCAGITLTSFSARSLSPLIDELFAEGFPDTGFKVGMSAGVLVAKKVGPRNERTSVGREARELRGQVRREGRSASADRHRERLRQVRRQRLCHSLVRLPRRHATAALDRHQRREAGQAFAVQAPTRRLVQSSRRRVLRRDSRRQAQAERRLESAGRMMTTSMLGDRGVALTQQLLTEAREELNRADNKASMLLAIFGVGFGAVLAGVVAGNWKPSDLTAGAEVVWWLGASAAAAALVAVGAAVWPRVSSEHATGRITYFAHVAGYRTREALHEAIERQSETDAERPIEQLRAISSIVMRKYRLVQLGLVLYGLGVLACVLSAIAS